VSETIQIHGVPVHVVDTAGLRAATDEVERIGIERSWQAIADADAVLFLHDLSRADDPAAQADDAAIADELTRAHAGEPLHVWNKHDLAPGRALPEGALALSAQTGAGLDALREALLERAGAAHVPDGVFIARTRHVEALSRTREHVEIAQHHADQRDAALDLFAEELRLAHQALGEITGQFTADDLLGEIFGRFCIGK
jgi:tRNA modification GTPase